MTSLSLHQRCSSSTPSQSVLVCPDMGKIPNFNMVTAEASRRSRSLHQYNKVSCMKTVSQSRTTRPSHTATIAFRNSRKSLCENTKAVSTLKAASTGIINMHLRDESPKNEDRNRALSTLCHLRTYRKRSFSEALGGKRISVLRFKKQKIGRYILDVHLKRFQIDNCIF